MLENRSNKCRSHQRHFKTETNILKHKPSSHTPVELKINTSRKHIKSFRINNKSINSTNFLPMIKEYKQGIIKIKTQADQINNRHSQTLSKKQLIHFFEVPNYYSCSGSARINPNSRKCSLMVTKNISKSRELSKMDISKVESKSRKSFTLPEEIPLFSNELISRITHTTFNGFLTKKEKSPRFVDLFKATESKLKNEKLNKVNIFLRPELICYAKN